MNKQMETIAQQANVTALPPEIIVLDAEGQPRIYKLMPQQAEVSVGEEYVDPFLFESGYFKSREEYEEVTRTARVISRIKQD